MRVGGGWDVGFGCFRIFPVALVLTGEAAGNSSSTGKNHRARGVPAALRSLRRNDPATAPGRIPKPGIFSHGGRRPSW
jgi:hypothetical protein